MIDVCSRCHTPYDEHAAFCRNCGMRKDEDRVPTPQNEFSTQAPGRSVSEPELVPTGESPDAAVSRMNEAARWINAEDMGSGKRLRRSARLSPLRDISGEIQRESTPHPSTKLGSPRSETEPGRTKTAERVSSANFPTIAPLLAAPDVEEKEPDVWAHTVDPLSSRERPRIAEGNSIDAEDIRRIQLEEHLTLPYPLLHAPKHKRRKGWSLWHVAIISMIVIAVTALAIDGLLFSFTLHHSGSSNLASGGPPTLALSTSIVNTGDSVSLYLTHFTPTTNVSLTHDFQQMLLTTQNTSVLHIDINGQATATFMVDTSWAPGFHMIVAEDVTTRATASATIQINGSGPTRPPHLLIETRDVNLGDAVQGANTIQSLNLMNSGSGTISWSVSSNQPWLLTAPQQGTFSSGQMISIAAQRGNLSPGDYSGSLTFSSPTGASESVNVRMTVNPLPSNAGAMISVAPPLLSFTAADGSREIQTQTISLSNPGQQPLYWTLSKGTSGVTTIQTAVPGSKPPTPDNTNVSGADSSWLDADQHSGVVQPGQTAQIQVSINSRDLLPNTYVGSLLFNATDGNRAYDSPQELRVALTVQPYCGLLTSSGSLSFTAVEGQNNPSGHALTLSSTSSCAGEKLDWQAHPSASWITVSPASGEIQGTSSNVTSIGVDLTNLTPNKRYSGLVTFQAGNTTQTLVVTLDLQPRPQPSEPLMGASPLLLNFSTIQGENNPAQQVVTITNNGGSPLSWHPSVSALGKSWITAVPNGATIPAGQTGQLTVNLMTKNLAAGTYTAQITLGGTNASGATASGSPQVITVSLVVQPPCTLSQPSSSSLMFTGLVNGANPLDQNVTFTTAGSCAWPLHWTTSLSQPASWLTLTPASGNLSTSAQQGSIKVAANLVGLAAGTYTTQVTINALDASGWPVQGTGQTFSVSLTVQTPCTLKPLPQTLNFTADAGQAAPTQTLTLGSLGVCIGGVSWTAATQAATNSWLSLSTTVGTDTGTGSNIVVTASASSLLPGTYTGQITITATNNGNATVGSPQTIMVTLTVSGYNVSGTAQACADQTCATPQPLANATVTLVVNGTTLTTTTDANGNFSFNNVPAGLYTLAVAGASGGANYSGQATGTISGNTSGITVNTLAS